MYLIPILIHRGAEYMTSALSILAGLLVGGIVVWLLASARTTKHLSSKIEDAERRAAAAQGRASGLEATIAELRLQNQKAAENVARLLDQLSTESGARIKAETQLTETMQRLEEEKRLLDDAKAKLADTFKALASDTLSKSTTSFLQLAKEALDKVLTEARGDIGKRQEAIQSLVTPLSESLAKFQEHLRIIEKDRQEAYSGLAEHLKLLSSSHHQLQQETARLVTALRKPQVRGKWGEMTLRRVVELAGMAEHCDFIEQVTTTSQDARLRPDMVVRLPAGREIVVDAKVSLEAYLDAVAAESEDARTSALARHAAQMRAHMNSLASKAYWSQFPKAPEFVVMFIPGESFFAAAADADRSLIEDGLAQRIILATPTTLIALLRAVAYGWRQEQIAKNAQEISELGRQLYERMRILIDNISKIGEGLEKATQAYNKSVRSLEARVLPAARRFKDLGAAVGNDIQLLAPVESAPRAITAPEAKEEE